MEEPFASADGNRMIVVYTRLSATSDDRVEEVHVHWHSKVSHLPDGLHRSLRVTRAGQSVDDCDVGTCGWVRVI